MNFFRIPRAKLQKPSELRSDVSTNETTSSADEISTVIERNREIRVSRPQGIQNEFQGPKNLYGRLPILGQQRFVINLMKFPSLISTICGCLIIFGNIFDFTSLMKSLAILSIASGSYSFVITWLICGQSNFQHTPGETGSLLNVKIIQLFGSTLFFTAQTILALFSILQIKGVLFDNVDVQWPSGAETATTVSETTTMANFDTKSTVLCLIGTLFAVGMIGVCLSLMATILAINAKKKLRKILIISERRNLARANAINFSFGNQLRVVNVN